MGEMMGDVVTGDPFRYDRDSGVIGEKKTLRPLKIYHEEKTGSTFRSPDKGNFATPQVTGGVARFDLGGDPFEFECLGWKYHIQNHWSNADATAENIGHSAHLESPDKKTLIHVSSVDLPILPPLNTHSMTPEQKQTAQEKRVAEDPFIGNESRMIAQQAVKWYLNQNINNYIVSEKDTPVHFTTENINGKEFVRTEFNVLNKKQNAVRKAVVWAYNYRAFWLSDDGKRHAYTWICQIITDPSEYSNVIAKARQIPETAEFKKHIPKN